MPAAQGRQNDPTQHSQEPDMHICVPATQAGQVAATQPLEEPPLLVEVPPLLVEVPPPLEEPA